MTPYSLVTELGGGAAATAAGEGEPSTGGRGLRPLAWEPAAAGGAERLGRETKPLDRAIAGAGTDPSTRARRGQLPAHTGVWTPGAAGLRTVCPPLPDTDAAPVDNRKRLTHRCLALLPG